MSDLKEQHIVIVGDPASGFAFHGPFEDADAATQWADFFIQRQQWCVAPIDKPEEYPDCKKLVIVNDGATQWAALKCDLIAALDAMEWNEGSALGLLARLEPDNEDASYSHLCSIITPADMPTNTDDCAKFTWYPAEGAWLWERT